MNLDLDTNTLAIAGVVALALLGEMRLLRRELKIFLAAIIERSRRRDARSRRESTLPPMRRREADAVPREFADEEDTDIHVLMEIERENQRSRRKTDRQARRPGERPPRPGTHHDRED